MDYLKIILIAFVAILISRFLFHTRGKMLKMLIANEIVGLAIIILLNMSGLLTIKLNLITAAVTGIFGVPGVVVLMVLTILGII